MKSSQYEKHVHVLIDPSMEEPNIPIIRKAAKSCTEDTMKKIFDMKSLDKWDEKHLAKSSHKKMKLRTVNLIEKSMVTNLTMKTNANSILSSLYNGLRSNENIRSFCKGIKEEESSVLAQNMHILKKRFDFDRFRKGDNNDDTKAYSNTNNINTRNSKSNIHHSFRMPTKPTRRKSILQTHEELYQVGNELAIRKTIKDKCKKTVNFAPNGKKAEIVQELQKDDEIRIENRTLHYNDLEIEGKYQKVVSSDYYKERLKERHQMEITYRKEIVEVEKEIEAQEAEIGLYSKAQKELYIDIEEKKRTYFDNKDALGVLTREREIIRLKKPMAIKNDFIHTLREIEHFNHLTNQIEGMKKEYEENQITNQWHLSNFRNTLVDLKSNLKHLKNHKENITKELIEYYYQLLKKGVDVRSTGLSWVIVCLYELGVEVTINDFPNFLDGHAAAYLIEFSKEVILKKKLNILLNLFINNFLRKDPNAEEINDIDLSLSTNQSYIMKEFSDLIHQIAKNKQSKFLLSNLANRKKDKMEIKKALEDIRTGGKSESRQKIFMKTESCNEEMAKRKIRSDVDSLEETRADLLISIKNSSINKRDVVDICDFIRKTIKKTEIKMNELKKKHMHLFKLRYDVIKQRGISECVRYDLMFCALFGNYAVI